MPADALRPDGVPGTSRGVREANATAVANAAVYGDVFKWHLADGAFFNLCSLWAVGSDCFVLCHRRRCPVVAFAERYGTYVNGSVGRRSSCPALCT